MDSMCSGIGQISTHCVHLYVTAKLDHCDCGITTFQSVYTRTILGQKVKYTLKEHLTFLLVFLGICAMHMETCNCLEWAGEN